MQITVKGHGLRVTDALRTYAEEKIGHLEHYDDRIIDATVTMRTERDVQIVDAMLNLPNFIVKAEERSQDMYASIDLVRDRLEQQILKHKKRLIDRHHRGNGRLATLAETTPEESDETQRIVRTKRFAMKPMHPEDAAHQMELLGHDFFVFVNAETERINVIYKRKSGDFGLIEPAG